MRKIGPFRLPRLKMLPSFFIMWGISLLIVIFERDLEALFFSLSSSSYALCCHGPCELCPCQPFFFWAALSCTTSWPCPAARGYLLNLLKTHRVTASNCCSRFISSPMAAFPASASARTPTYIPVVESDFIFPLSAKKWVCLAQVQSSCSLSFWVSWSCHCCSCKIRRFSICGSRTISVLVFQAFLIIGGVTKLLPLTGVISAFHEPGRLILLSSFIIVVSSSCGRRRNWT